MRPHTTIRNLLVHLKDKVMTAETAEYVKRIRCKISQKVYTVETSRSFEVIIKEQEKEVELQKRAKIYQKYQKIQTE